jgi:hypothetical protein
LFADDEAAFDAIKAEVTATRVKEHFGELVQGDVVRYEAANVLALNFVLHDILAGGASRSLRADTQGKTFALALLRMRLEPRPDNLGAMRRPGRKKP